ncbi:MAG: efflux RND transporter periplasmic adaptor subunit [Cytophagales bacterium]|nr:efflux RND transporter periplasmic adaptor subunit [Cytophagales bacterium]
MTSDPLTVTVSSAMAGNFNIQPLTNVEMSLSQDIAGRIDTNERLLTRIGAAVTGRVTDLLVEVGDTVKAGQTLARISSPELTTAQLSFLRASSNTTLAERALERAKQLLQADVIGSAELQRRESELSIAKAEMRAAADQLRLMGLPNENIEKLRDQGSLHPHANVVATRSGVVTERKVSQGQVTQPGEPMFTVADLSSVWVIGALPEQAARSVQTGQKIEISVPALGEKTITGKVVYVSDTISPETRSVTVRTQVDNPKRDLKPQMLAILRIASAPINTLAVPVSAVVRESDKDHVYVQIAPLRFRMTAVDLGPASNGFRPVNKGLSLGASVVTEGAFHLNNERKRAELE